MIWAPTCAGSGAKGEVNGNNIKGQEGRAAGAHAGELERSRVMQDGARSKQEPGVPSRWGEAGWKPWQQGLQSPESPALPQPDVKGECQHFNDVRCQHIDQMATSW